MYRIKPSTASLAVLVGLTSCGVSDEPPNDPFSLGGSTGGGSGGTGATAAGGSGGGNPSGGSPTGGGGNPTGGITSTPCTNVRPTGTEWDEATCDQWATETDECSQSWMIDGKYCSESCGRCNSK